MFRNGFNATRRSLLTIAHSRSLPLATRDISNSGGGFICVSCQFRSLHMKSAKKSKGQKSETFLSAIKRLEAHVQRIEKNYIDKVKLQEALKELPDHEITEELQDKAYAALMATPDAPAAFLPAPTTILDRLPALIVTRLGEFTALVTQKKPDWDLILYQLEKNEGFVGLSSWEVNNLIYYMSLNERATLSEKLLGMMSIAGVLPDTLTFDLLMLAHAARVNSQEVKRLFADMNERGLRPTVYSYAHLLKAYSQLSDVSAATLAIEEMHNRSILPNLVIYTTLIQTCLSRNQFATAWQIFDLIKLKSTATAPDAHTYTLMIHACAANGEVERALDLFTDMTVRRGIPPSRETYHTLIHACALRKDYFAQAWRFATQMQQEGMSVNKMYLNVLIQACGRTGELTRARLLVRHMMASSRERRNVQPDDITFQNLMRAYATYRAPAGEGGKKAAAEGGKVISELDFVGAGTGRLEKRVQGEKDEEIPFLKKGVLNTHKEVLSEAKLVMGWIKENKPQYVNTQLLNAYMDVCLVQGGGFPTKKCYDRFFSAEEPATEKTAGEEGAEDIGKPVENEEQISDETAEEDEEEPVKEEEESPTPEPVKPNVTKNQTTTPTKNKLPPRNIFTFEIALRAALSSADLPFARRIMVDRDQFKLTKTYWTMHPEERKKHDFTAERLMIDILARCEFLGEAAERIRKTWESGEWEWKREHLRTLYVRAVQCEDWSTVQLCRRISGKLDQEY